MKKVTAALIGSAALAVTSGLLFLHFSDKEKKPSDDTRTTESRTYKPRQRGIEEQRIAELARHRSVAGRNKLLQLYAAWAGKPDFEHDRRAVISHIIENEEPWTAMNLILEAVSKDPIPLENDEMLNVVARDMTGVWRDTTYIAHARDLLRLTKDPKKTALLAESLSWRLNSPPSDLPSVEGQRHQLASDLLQTYIQTNDQELKRRLLQNVEMVASSDVAEVLASPENAEQSRLAQKLEQQRKEAAEKAFSLK